MIIDRILHSKLSNINQSNVEELIELNILKVLLSCFQCSAGILFPLN